MHKSIAASWIKVQYKTFDITNSDSCLSNAMWSLRQDDQRNTCARVFSVTSCSSRCKVLTKDWIFRVSRLDYRFESCRRANWLHIWLDWKDKFGSSTLWWILQESKKKLYLSGLQRTSITTTILIEMVQYSCFKPNLATCSSLKHDKDESKTG